MAARGRARFSAATVQSVSNHSQGKAANALTYFPRNLEARHRRDGKENGVVFFPTCHREYFTKPIVALSPPVHILRKILSSLQNKSGDILIRGPPKSVLKGAKWLQDVAHQTGDTTAFIMDAKDTVHAGDRTQKSISLMSRTSEEYLWRLPIPLKVVLAVLIQASISIMSLSPGEEILLAQEIHLFLRRSVHSVPRIMNAHTSDRSSEPGDNDVTHSLSGSSPPPPLLFGTAAPVLIKKFKFKFQYVLEPEQASVVEATRRTLPIQGYYRSSNEISYTAEGAMLACRSMLPALVAQLATLKIGSLMRKHVWGNYITRLTKPEKPITRIAFRGPTGAGKSSPINALLGVEPMVTCVTRENSDTHATYLACTATPIEISYHGKATIEADIHFVSREEWLEDLQQLCDDIRDFSDVVQKRVEIAWSKVILLVTAQ
ncbi:hypothetical protein B0H14DRAFT_3713098 [Mycena olivaceomarginata]|nr:hypothetical protein B0H14DRAFT_3713098 [Mycena olivaceomarginata]